MTRIKKSIITTCAAALTISGSTAIAAAATEYVGGGTWEYGVGGGRVFSDYFHGSVHTDRPSKESPDSHSPLVRNQMYGHKHPTKRKNGAVMNHSGATASN